MIQSAVDAAGPQAARIAALWWLMFWALAAVFVLVMVALGWALVHRRRSIAAVGYEPLGRVERRMGVAVGVAVGGTVVILLVLLVVSVSTGRSLSALRSHDPLTIEVTGRQWWWEVQYDASLPSERVTTANEIRIPVGRPVLVKLRSPDVIHSFWVPNLHGKRDLIPGLVNSIWLQADRAGVFRAQCAEYCGLQHAHMALAVVAEEPAAFEAWLAAQRQPAPEPADDLARRGRDVFLAGSCVMCHRIRGTDAGATAGPDLTHVASRLTLAAGTLPNSVGNLAGWILDPQAIKPGTQMPANSFAPDDLQALLAYLGSLR